METTVSKVTVDKVEPSLKAGLAQAQVRQVLSKVYPKAKVSNNLKDQFFSNEELAIADGKAYSEERVAWIEVPEKFTKEQTEAHLNKNFPEMTLYKVLSSTPILSDDQEQVLKNGLSGDALTSFNTKYGIAEGTVWGEQHLKFFIAAIVDRQVVRYGEGNEEGKPADEVVLYNGKQQFRRVEASVSKRSDIDLRKPEIAVTENIEMAPSKEEVKETAKA